MTAGGLFFRNTVQTGSPALFLFGSRTTWDNQINFDAQFAQDFGNSGVYKFRCSPDSGHPTFVTRDGANEIALISQGDITSSPLGGTVNLNGLNGLFLGTVSGSITLSDKFTFTKANGGSFKEIELYARGGSVDFGSLMNLKDANLLLSAQQNVNVDSTASILANTTILTALGNATIDGNITSHFGQVYAGGILTVNGSVNSDSFFGLAIRLRSMEVFPAET